MENPKRNGWKDAVHNAKEWTGQHKTELIICGGFVIGVVAGILVYKRINIVEPILKSATPNASPVIAPVAKVITVTQTAQATTSSLDAIDPIKMVRTVCEHSRSGGIRNLPEGWKASLAKIAEAAEKGIALEEGQTIVNSCIVGNRCA